MDDDFVVALELSLLAFNIKNKVCGVSNGFLSFFKKYDKKRSHDMLSLTLRPRLKNLLLVSSIMGFPLWKSMKNNPCFQCFSNATKSYTLW